MSFEDWRTITVTLGIILIKDLHESSLTDFMVDYKVFESVRGILIVLVWLVSLQALVAVEISRLLVSDSWRFIWNYVEHY